MRKLIIGAIAVTSLAGGSVALAVTNPLGIAGAQGDPGTTIPAATDPAPPTTTTPTTPPDAPDEGKKGDGHGRGHAKAPQVLEQTLSELVANGTITQAQADAIIAALKAKVGDAGGPGGPGRPGFPGGAMKGEIMDAAAAAIGIDREAMITDLKAGKSLAEIAQAHGVDPQKVIDAITAKITAQIDQGVADGKIPAERAAKMKEQLAAHVAEMVNSTHTGPGRGHGKGPHRPGDDKGDDDPSTPGTTPN
jgi:hypothetical protein